MLDKPQDSPGELRKAVEAFGGKVHYFFFTICAFDGLAIVEFPDNESCAACRLTLTGAGANRALTTTVLLSSAEGDRAMQQARQTRTGYQPPRRLRELRLTPPDPPSLNRNRSWRKTPSPDRRRAFASVS